VSKQRIDEEKTVRQQFEKVLSLRKASRTAEAKAQSDKCEAEWLKLKKMLRASN
jgi:hypothetical protein